MKKIKFVSNLVPLILSGEKVSTFRLWDDKNLSVGDEVEMIEKETGRRFAVAKLTKVVVKKLGELAGEDLEGHEKFTTKKEMYQQYQGFYGRRVDGETLVKLIWFEISA